MNKYWSSGRRFVVIYRHNLCQLNVFLRVVEFEQIVASLHARRVVYLGQRLRIGREPSKRLLADVWNLRRRKKKAERALVGELDGVHERNAGGSVGKVVASSGGYVEQVRCRFSNERSY